MLNKINISPDKQKLIIYVALIVVTFAVFWQVNQNDFINLDDDVYVTENLRIQSGLTLEGVRWAFSSTYAGLWHPLTWLSLMFDYQLYGLNAGGYHLTNLILHSLSTLLLFWLFNRMTGAIWKSAFIAALFALHPLHVESVVWIAKRKDVLSAFFWMLTLCLYVYYSEKPVIKRYLLVLFSFVLALMSKPTVVTLPVIMILFDYWPLKRFESQEGSLVLRQLKEKIPFFMLSAFFSIIAIYANHKPSVEHFPLADRMANAPVSFVTYLVKTFWPHDLAVYYPFLHQLPVGQVLGAVLLIIVISVVAIAMVKRLPYLFVGWLWYATTIFPVIGIIQVNAQALSDHYTYLPLIGISIMLAWGIPSLVKSENIRRNILFPAGIAVLAILAFLTWQQGCYWENSITLYNHALQLTKDNHRVHNNRGIAYAMLGQYQLAIKDFNEALRLQPYYEKAYSNRGNAYAELGQYKLAFEDFNKAIQLKPDDAEAYYNRGNTYAKLGQYKRAAENYNEAIRLKTNDAYFYYNRGIAYAKLGQYKLAIENFNKAIHLKPYYTEAYYSRGVAYLLQGNNKYGCLDAQKVCALGNCQLIEYAKDKGFCR